MNPGSPSSSRYGWLSDEQLAAAMQRNPDMLQPIRPPVVVPAQPVPTAPTLLQRLLRALRAITPRTKD